MKLGDTITLGGVPLVFLPQTVGEREELELEKKRQAERPAAMWPSFLWLTVFQILTAVQLTVAAGEEASPLIPSCFLILTVFMWLYAAILRLGRCVGFELETIAFYLSTLSLAVTASSVSRLVSGNWAMMASATSRSVWESTQSSALAMARQKAVITSSWAAV